jgi:hypothetical protein
MVFKYFTPKTDPYIFLGAQCAASHHCLRFFFGCGAGTGLRSIAKSRQYLQIFFPIPRADSANL